VRNTRWLIFAPVAVLAFASPTQAVSFSDPFDDLSQWTVVRNGGNGVIANGALRFSYGWGEVVRSILVSEPSLITLTVTVDNSQTNSIGWGAPIADSYRVGVGGNALVSNEIHGVRSVSVSYEAATDESVLISLSGVDNGFWAGWYGTVMDDALITVEPLAPVEETTTTEEPAVSSTSVPVSTTVEEPSPSTTPETSSSSQPSLTVPESYSTTSTVTQTTIPEESTSLPQTSSPQTTAAATTSSPSSSSTTIPSSQPTTPTQEEPAPVQQPVPIPPTGTSSTTTTTTTSVAPSTTIPETTTTSTIQPTSSTQPSTTSQKPTTTTTSTSLPEPSQSLPDASENPIPSETTPTTFLSLEAVPEPVANAPEEVKEAYEEQVNIFDGAHEDYVPAGSTITVAERRTIVAATTILMTLPAPVRRKT
jgi:hypothetical protein